MSIEKLKEAMVDMDFSGRPVCIHSSMRSFRPSIDANDLLDVFLNRGATVLVPTFSYDFETAPPIEDRPKRNGMVYPDDSTVTQRRRDFSTHSQEISLREMGQFTRAVLLHPQSQRGRHPLNSFSSVGPLAKELIDKQSPQDVYAPLDALINLNGLVLLMGVTYTSLTLLHLAEMRAGRRPFRRWAYVEGKLTNSSVGSCSAGFRKFEPLLDPIADMRVVCNSQWRTLPALEALMTATGAIHLDPPMTHCEDANCLRCPDAIAGGPL